ncbi:permease-like cell division protein FtsX [Catenuloplanes japonicus]|uniref:permease-like cell division protein FtsX n=1 Tax=Catenuloplanes japonicus TaxID=33876 RepID=UPI0012FBADB2|nr:permease-like cell division protein FtsX [Catenuloplanes japonicus]
MDQELRDLFGKAVADEPVPLGDITLGAIADGTRIRRRRRLLAGGSALAVALAVALGAVNVLPRTWEQETAPVAVVVPLAMLGGGEPCHVGAGEEAAEVAMFLRADITDAQRAELDRRLAAEEIVRDFAYEDREKALEKFEKLWRDSPDVVGSVTADQLPESFRIHLTDDRLWAGLAQRYEQSPGVDQILGTVCMRTPR